MRINNELTEQDFVEAEGITPARLHVSFWIWYGSSRLVMLISFLGALFFVFFTLLLVLDAGWSWSTVGRAFIVLAIVGASFGSRFRQAWRLRFGRAQERFRKYKYRIFDSIEVDSEGLHLGSLICRDLVIPFTQFSGFHEGKRIFLLIRMNSHEELLIPKVKMNAAEVDELRRLLVEKVGKW